MYKQVIDISFFTMLKAALLVVLLWALWVLRDVAAVLLLAIVIASAVEPAAHWFARHRIPRVLGVIFVYCAAFFVFIATFYLIIPPLFNDAFDFVSNLPAYLERTLESDSMLFVFLPDLPSNFKEIIRETALALEESIQSFLAAISTGVFSFGSALFGGAFSFVLLVVISFYLSVQEHGIENFLRIVTPLEHEVYILDLWGRAQRKIGRWLQGQILLGVLIGIMVFLMLTILNVKHAALLAILSALFELIPVFGPIMAAIPAIAIAALQSPLLGLMVAGLYVLVQQIENHLIYPLVVRKTVGVPPLLAILSLVVGIKLGGLFGALLSVPIAAVLIEVLNDVSAKKYPKSS
ncbi:hypothetical protein A3J56_02940 [Candidatus Giovannonibacteria bacterium RIFCSPHIGHO2_02_FULL_46_20]|uniref:AI-2E family transporter n=1 Tax=Candidatus Giovannonibacteria bacterium RIFCSPHIGHO2_02_FULL_46_20 TaxID=1798338 RepID=A0A1F5WDW6_9BACT|nr:MAG: hypothetical protein A3J56_02940 [Candidatus Giovannonibacteria bacterium RIFCSPHIGHO2_02_FULL_46_20]